LEEDLAKEIEEQLIKGIKKWLQKN
jgi:hypothetical protein